MNSALTRITSILLAAALACVFAASVLAADDGYKQNVKQASATYKMDRKGCDGVKGDEKKDCLRLAKTKYHQAITEARKDKAKK